MNRRSPLGLRIPDFHNNQGRHCEASRLSTIACYLGLWLWITAPIRWVRRKA